MKSKGLGDKIENVLKKTGIKKIVNKIFTKKGTECGGCDKRKKWLNEKFPAKNPSGLKIDEHEVLKEFFSVKKNYISAIEQKALISINNRVFNQKLEMSSCPSCVITLVNKMKTLFENYEEKN